MEWKKNPTKKRKGKPFQHTLPHISVKIEPQKARSSMTFHFVCGYTTVSKWFWQWMSGNFRTKLCWFEFILCGRTRRENYPDLQALRKLLSHYWLLSKSFLSWHILLCNITLESEWFWSHLLILHWLSGCSLLGVISLLTCRCFIVMTCCTRESQQLWLQTAQLQHNIWSKRNCCLC